MPRRATQRLLPHPGERPRRTLIVAQSQVRHSRRHRQTLLHRQPFLLLRRLARFDGWRDHAGHVGRRGLGLPCLRSVERFKRRFGFDDVVADKGVVAQLERDLCAG